MHSILEDLRCFTVTPTKATLQPGDSITLTLTYNHAFLKYGGLHTIPILMKLGTYLPLFYITSETLSMFRELVPLIHSSLRLIHSFFPHIHSFFPLRHSYFHFLYLYPSFLPTLLPFFLFSFFHSSLPACLPSFLPSFQYLILCFLLYFIYSLSISIPPLPLLNFLSFFLSFFFFVSLFHCFLVSFFIPFIFCLFLCSFLYFYLSIFLSLIHYFLPPTILLCSLRSFTLLLSLTFSLPSPSSYFYLLLTPLRSRKAILHRLDRKNSSTSSFFPFSSSFYLFI